MILRDSILSIKCNGCMNCLYVSKLSGDRFYCDKREVFTEKGNDECSVKVDMDRVKILLRLGYNKEKILEILEGKENE